MKYLLIILSLFLTFISWSKDVDYDNLVERDGLWYEKFSDVPFSGYSKGLHQGKINEGKRDGQWLIYYKSGQLEYKLNYKNGKQHGEQLFFYENEQVNIKGTYKDNKKEGDHIIYRSNGELLAIFTYQDNELINRIEY